MLTDFLGILLKYHCFLSVLMQKEVVFDYNIMVSHRGACSHLSYITSTQMTSPKIIKQSGFWFLEDLCITCQDTSFEKVEKIRPLGSFSPYPAILFLQQFESNKSVLFTSSTNMLLKN